jgi:uncharacterized protein YkwD
MSHLAVLLLLVGTAVAVHAAERAPKITPPIASIITSERYHPDLDEASRLVVDGTNTLRVAEGRPRLIVNESLSRAARQFAKYMADTDQYGHEADGRTLAQRVAVEKISWCALAENIAYQYVSTGFTTEDLARSLVDGWIDSPGHHRNMVDPDVTEIGVGIARSARSGRYYAVQDFARPKQVATACLPSSSPIRSQGK